MNNGLGQYDSEYAHCTCFWGTEPGKFVRKVPDYIRGGSVLDLGAGEGKNAIFLARLGFRVTAVECSEYAIANFRTRLRTERTEGLDRITIFCNDVRSFAPEHKYNVVIAYGLLHCLPSIRDVDDIVQKMQHATQPGGVNIAVAFTDALGIPAVQDYLEPTLLPPDYLSTAYKAWNVLDHENAVITESHPTSQVTHQHSVCRILARRPYAEESH